MTLFEKRILKWIQKLFPKWVPLQRNDASSLTSVDRTVVSYQVCRCLRTSIEDCRYSVEGARGKIRRGFGDCARDTGRYIEHKSSLVGRGIGNKLRSGIIDW